MTTNTDWANLVFKGIIIWRTTCITAAVITATSFATTATAKGTLAACRLNRPLVPEAGTSTQTPGQATSQPPRLDVSHFTQ